MSEWRPLLIEIGIFALAIFVGAKVLPGVRVMGFWNAILTGLMFGIFNALFSWSVEHFNFLSGLGSFVKQGGALIKLVFNALILWLIGKVFRKGFQIDGFPYALLAAFVTILLSELLMWLLRAKLSLI